MLIILFGLAGSGKNYVGEILANEFGYHYWDADLVMPKEMHAAIQKKELFTQAMRDELTALIIKNISELKKKHPKLVISQALYKEKNRNQLLQAYPDAKLIEVKASAENRAAHIRQRNDEVDEVYAEKISHNYETPRILHGIITNNGGRTAIIDQLKKII